VRAGRINARRGALFLPPPPPLFPFVDDFNRADNQLVAHNRVVYNAGRYPLAYIVSDACQAEPSPDLDSVATAFVDPLSITQTISLDITDIGDVTTFSLWLRTTAGGEEENSIQCVIDGSIGSWTMTIYKWADFSQSLLATEGGFSSTPVDMTASINGEGDITFAATGLTSMSANDNTLAGTACGFDVLGTMVLDNLNVIDEIIQPANISTAMGTLGDTSASWPHNNNGSLLIVAFGASENGADTSIPTAVTFNGEDLSFIGQVTDVFTIRMDVWALVDPSIGTFDIEATFDQGIISNSYCAISIVDGAAPTGVEVAAFNASEGWHNPVTVDLVGEPGGIFVCCGYNRTAEGAEPTTTDGATVAVAASHVNNWCQIATAPGADSITIGFSNDDNADDAVVGFFVPLA
jgi:hypothetical protein